MNFTFDQHVVPFPILDNPKEPWQRRDFYFLPDQIMNAYISLQHWMLAYWHRNRHLQHDPYSLRMQYSEIVECACYAIQRVSPEFVDLLRIASDKGWIEVAPLEGDVGGQCQLATPEDEKPATITLSSSDFLFDAAILTHEAGHYVAAARGNHKNIFNNTFRSSSTNLLGEIQAIFMEQFFYWYCASRTNKKDQPEFRRFKNVSTYNFIGRHVGAIKGCKDAVYWIKNGFYSKYYDHINKNYELHHNYNYACALLMAGGLFYKWKMEGRPFRYKLLNALYPTTHSDPGSARDLKIMLEKLDMNTDAALAKLFFNGGRETMGILEKVALYRHNPAS